MDKCIRIILIYFGIIIPIVILVANLVILYDIIFHSCTQELFLLILTIPLIFIGYYLGIELLVKTNIEDFNKPLK